MDPKKGVKRTWESLCKHKSEGGMGFRNLHIFNIAMLDKLVWRLHYQPNSLIGRILKARHFPNTDYFEVRLGSNPSYTWKGIHTAMDLVKCGLRWKIGAGNSIPMWGDSWLDNDRNFYIGTVASVPTFEDMVIKNFFSLDSRSVGEHFAQI